jgi:WD40 repeat protein
MPSISGSCSVGHYDGSLTIWNLNMRQCLAHDKLHSGEVRGVSYSADGRYVASASFDKNIIITDTLNLDNISVVKTLEHDDKVVSVKWHPYMPLLLSTSADKSAKIWSPN